MAKSGLRSTLLGLCESRDSYQYNLCVPLRTLTTPSLYMLPEIVLYKLVNIAS